eukprot:CAMPEP_0115467816 /NCGR_PEP_ID=MMETSP0271-20121206/50630_1 /TAXON_ID=71861 /ORGANISM="Scrippsiella trochoidea, Strain CCMP3099" /LENGTH=899 /DNA_ID=CAMNT_0002894837 /DNA_START=12 /DNA_END=2711 /DNA_ORIENTATION=+
MSGLIVTRDGGAPAERVPPKSVHVDVDVVERIARHRLAQTFVNTSPSCVEAAYVFPLLDGAAISALRVLFSSGKEILGEVRERAAAEAAFNDAMSRGLRTAMLREESGDVFRTSIGNLGPGEEVEVSLEYCLELPVIDQAVRLTIPSHVAPRYCPSDGMTAAEVCSQAAISGYSSTAPGAAFAAKVEVNMAGGVCSVESPTHAVALTRHAAESGKILAEVQCSGLQCDIVLAIFPRELFRPVVTREVHIARGTEALMLSFVPRFDAVPQRIEAVFLLDCSGSMGGQRIEQAKRATQIFLRSLPTDCFFNIVLFGSTYKTLYSSGSVAYSQASLQKATDYVDRISANLGGTNILEPLSSILPQPPVSGTQRQIFLLTDGQVSNQQAIIDLVRAHRCRVFSIGIGSGVSTALVNGVARASRASAAFVQDREGLEAVCIDMLRKASSRSVADVTVSWPAIPALRSQTSLPPIVSGEGFSTFTLFPHTPLPEGATVKVTGDLGTRRLEFEVPVPPSWSAVDSGSEAILHHMFARRLLAEMQEADPPTMSPSDAVQLSVAYSVLCAHTAFVAMDRHGTEMPTGVVKASDLAALRGLFTWPMGSRHGAKMPTGLAPCRDPYSAWGGRNPFLLMRAAGTRNSLEGQCSNIDDLVAKTTMLRSISTEFRVVSRPADGSHLPSVAGVRSAIVEGALGMLRRVARVAAALPFIPVSLRASLGGGHSTRAATVAVGALPQQERQQQQQQAHGSVTDPEIGREAASPLAAMASASGQQPCGRAAVAIGTGGESVSKLARLEALLRLADFDGSFKHSPELQALIGLDMTWTSAWAQEQWGGAVSSQVLVTAGVLGHLARQFADDHATWDLVASKSKEWLRSRESLWRGGGIDSVDELLKVAGTRARDSHSVG